jgi:AcrR family transcriptional regulator
MFTVAPMTRRLTQRGKERRQQLMDYAAARFAENGYHPTSVAEIVQGLGVGKGVFYWYFDSKEQLFVEILRDAQHSLRRAQEQAIADEDDPVRRIGLGIRASMQWSAEHRDVNQLIQFAVTDERFIAAIRKGQEVAVADVMQHLSEGVERGLIRDADPLMLAHAVLGVTTHLARVFLHERRDSADEVADAAVSFVMEGLLVPDAVVTAR